eukprot:1153064-Pelagomonas_calceolata.AAC.3
MQCLFTLALPDNIPEMKNLIVSSFMPGSSAAWSYGQKKQKRLRPTKAGCMHEGWSCLQDVVEAIGTCILECTHFLRGSLEV